MSKHHFGLSIPTQRRLFALHLTKTTDHPVRRYGGALVGWLILSALVFAGLVAL